MNQTAIFIALFSMLVSAGSLVFAILSFRKSHRIERRHLAIEEARRADEEAALLVAQFHFDGKRRVLRISNKGKGTARNIKLLLDDHPITKHPCYVKGQSEITKISGLNHADYLLSLTMSGPIPSNAQIYWDDDVREGNQNVTSLTL